jgi:trehalose 6-phosphate phosphatase
MDSAAQAGWDAIVADPGGALVALDYDGVLAPIVPDPDSAVPAPGAIEALRRLAARVGTLAVVTGRPA